VRGAVLDPVLARARDRTASVTSFFEREADRLARCCRELAGRFAAGGSLLAIGHTAAERSDAEHVAVEFVHPVIVGKRALPAVAITPAGGPLADQVRSLARPGDVALGFGGGGEVAEALGEARRAGCMTVSFGGAAEWAFSPGGPDAFADQEIAEIAYHLLWELVHVFFEHGSVAGADAGPAGFLYPFLGTEQRSDDAQVVADVRESVLAKAADVARLRERTLLDHAEPLAAAASGIRATLDAGGAVLAFGNGGSATDAADLVADLRFGSPAEEDPRPGPRRALDLSAESAVLTAIANDVGIEEAFRRQLIAHGRRGDVAVAISTSGDSANLVAALEECRSRGIESLALVGGAGGRIAAGSLATWIVTVASDHVPRIQEAQASALHALCELIER
jgi:D-sedoheptulose 7-phosphate isomerase